jgi:hypothetical protein
MTFWNTFKHRVSLARKLSLSDWLALAEAWLGLLFSWILLRLRSAESMGIPSRARSTGLFSAADFSAAKRLHRLVELASRLYPWPMTCLPRALALRWMLARRGVAGDLQVGVQKAASGMQAHAWVELGGQPVGEPPDLLQRFSRLSAVKRGQQFD